ATLAAIVTDPAPPLRGARPDVPPGLETAVLRGLQRDRQRRWQDLGELRTALLPFAPGQVAGGERALRCGAFLLDMLLFLGLGLLLSFLPDAADKVFEERVNTVVGSVLYILYFAVLEGVWGCSLGKRLLRLRVWRADTRAAPGLARGLLRTLAFYTLT